MVSRLCLPVARLFYTRFPTLRERLEAVKASLGEIKPDLVLANVNLVNVYSGEIEHGVDVAIKGRLIVRVGDCSDLKSKFPDVRIVECHGLYAAPGLIDAHVHIESSMLVPRRFAELALAHGVTAVFYDCHEIGNVLGVEGIREFSQECSKLPLYAFLTVPSCVPACKLGLETTPNVLSFRELEYLKESCPDVAALGEVMDYISVLSGDLDILRSISEYYKDRLRINAHAAGLAGPQLQAYIAAGPDSDHEVTDPEEALEKIRRGLYLMIRLGTYSQDLYRVLPELLRREEDVLDRVMIVSDDVNALDLCEQGYLDRAVRETMKLGVDLPTAVKLCTLNPVVYYGLDWLIGGIAPGRAANMLLVEDSYRFKVRTVICDGLVVFKDGKLLISLPEHRYPATFYHTVKVSVRRPEDLSVKTPIESGEVTLNVIRFETGSVVTRLIKVKAEVRERRLVLPEGLLYICVVERHGVSGTHFTGVATGVPLERGALAMTICHDSHNMVVVGSSEEDMYIAIKELERCGGGLCIVNNREVKATVSLPVAGLMSEEKPERLCNKLRKLLCEWRRLGGSGKLQDLAPLMLTSLVVIPEVRLTDRGLVRVKDCKFIPLMEVS